MEPFPARDYDPIHPRGTDWRGLARRAFGPVIAVGVALLKFGFIAIKFAGLFIAVGGYALIWGWRFAIGFVALIAIHEMGHFIEAKREGLSPKLPVFVPFLGAYVRYTRGNPWQTARVALAGPMLGGLAALAFYLIGVADHSSLLKALGYFGFLLNLFNLIPIGILDGGAIWRSAGWLRRGGGGAKALITYTLYFGTAVALIVGMMASHVSQHRL
jgi:Zn-dependent protease